jgi:hypothetical protein
VGRSSAGAAKADPEPSTGTLESAQVIKKPGKDKQRRKSRSSGASQEESEKSSGAVAGGAESQEASYGLREHKDVRVIFTTVECTKIDLAELANIGARKVRREQEVLTLGVVHVCDAFMAAGERHREGDSSYRTSGLGPPLACGLPIVAKKWLQDSSEARKPLAVEP